MQYACQRVQTPHRRGRVGRAAGELPRLAIPNTAQTRPSVPVRHNLDSSLQALSSLPNSLYLGYIWVQRLGTSPVPVRSASTADGPLAWLGRGRPVAFDSAGMPTQSAPSGRMGRRRRASVHPTNDTRSSVDYTRSAVVFEIFIASLLRPGMLWIPTQPRLGMLLI